MAHKYITCSGFGGTGSSMVTDLMAEFRSVKGCGDFEWTLAFDIDGISDLQHYIVDDFEKIKTTEGIYRFRRHSKIVAKGYSRMFGTDVKGILDEYVDSLIDVSWMGSNNLQYYRYNLIGRKLYYLYCKARFEITKFFSSNNGYERAWNKPKVLLELSSQRGKFFELTQRMYARLLDTLDKDNKYEFLCFDQLVPSFNFKRYSRYFPNLKIICVDRDPRDLYLLNELYWHEDWIPSDDLDTFVKWFKLLRKDLKAAAAECDNVMLVKFEDAIYNYEETVSKICDFVGLKQSDHINKKSIFNPDYSIRNTKLWEKDSSHAKEIEIIERELSYFCYDYNNIK